MFPPPQIMYLIGVLSGASACVWIFLGTGEVFRTYLVYCVAVLLGCGGSTMLVTSLSITAGQLFNLLVDCFNI